MNSHLSTSPSSTTWEPSMKNLLFHWAMQTCIAFSMLILWNYSVYVLFKGLRTRKPYIILRKEMHMKRCPKEVTDKQSRVIVTNKIVRKNYKVPN